MGRTAVVVPDVGRIWFGVIAALFLFVGTAICDEGMVPNRRATRWKVLTLAEQDGFSFRLKYIEEASIADEQWLILELENVDAETIEVDNLHFRIGYGTEPTGYPAGSLVSGIGPYDVFPECWDTPTPSGRLLKRGQTRIAVDPISNDATTHLGIASNGGATIKGTTHLAVNLDHGPGTEALVIRTSRNGIPFKFKWKIPDAEGVDRMERRLRNLLKAPEHRSTRSQKVVARLLEVSDVTDRFTDEELAQALEIEHVRPAARFAAAKVLYEREPANVAGAEFYRDEFSLGFSHVQYYWPRYWTPGFVRPLTELLSDPRRSRKERQIAQYLLDPRPDDKQTDSVSAEIVTIAERQQWWQQPIGGLPREYWCVIGAIGCAIGGFLGYRWWLKRNAR